MNEPSLADIQRWFKAAVQPGSAGRVEPLAPVLNTQRGVPGRERLSIYAGGYLTRIHDALAEVYEAVQHILGKEAFANLSHAYAQRHPSHDYNLSFAGRDLPSFLTTSPLAERLPLLPDLAALEWAVCQAFHAFEQPPLDPALLRSMPSDAWDRAHLTFQPSVRLITSAWPILDVWNARTQPREQIAIDVVSRPQRVLICRRNARVACELLTEPQSLLLERLLAGATLGEACAALAQQLGASPPPIEAWFAGWMRAQLIIGLQRVESCATLPSTTGGE